MSDDGYSGADSQIITVNSVSGKQRKGPRFSWTPAYEATFFRSLCESVSCGLKDNHSFKQEAWDRAMTALREQHGAYPNKGHLINKSDNARKKFRLWRGLREDPEFLYNPTTRTVTSKGDAWKKHIEREPLSRSLKGRPFEHEEYMEILFPDVIGSGGAPKRITKQRRRGTGTFTGGEEQETPGAAVLDLLNENSFVSSPQHQQQQQQQQKQHQQQQQQQHTQTVLEPTPHISHLPAISTTGLPATPQQQQRPSTTAIPPRTTIASTSALTPPDESVPSVGGSSTTRKRTVESAQSTFVPPDKRRRTTANAYIDPTHPAQQARAIGNANPRPAFNSQHSSHSSSLAEDFLIQLGEAVKTARQPRWTEQAIDIFFRDFSDEEMDLQIKIAEKALTDTNKALLFCKMTPELRRHWVKRLREAHNNRSGNSVVTN